MNRKRVLPRYCGYFTDARGKQRLRFRMKGKKTAYPSSAPGTPEFLAKYSAFLGNVSAQSKTTHEPGSVSAVIARYYRSTDFLGLSAGTQVSYRRIFERFRSQHGAKKIASVATSHVNALIDEKAATPAAAKIFRKRLKQLMDFAVGAGLRKDNPVIAAKRVKYKDKGIRPWTEQDILDFRAMWGLDTPQRIAVEILLHTGLRRSDAVRLGKQHLRKVADGSERFVIRTRKSQATVELTSPVHPVLSEALSQIPSGQMVYVTTAYGAARSEKAFTNWIREAAASAGLPSNSSPHGLRKAACRRLADAGCDPFQIQAITGHKNLDEVLVYVRDRDQAIQAGKAMDNYAKSFPKTGK